MRATLVTRVGAGDSLGEFRRIELFDTVAPRAARLCRAAALPLLKQTNERRCLSTDRIHRTSARAPCRMTHAPLARCASPAMLHSRCCLGRAAAATRAEPARAVRGGARLRRDVSGGTRAGRLGAVPRRAGRGTDRAERGRQRRCVAHRLRPADRLARQHEPADRNLRDGRQPLFNRANSADHRAGRAGRWTSRRPNSRPPSRTSSCACRRPISTCWPRRTRWPRTRASKTAIAEQLASAKRNFEVGTATITDTREAQARFDLATAQEIAAENDLRTKRIALDSWSAVPASRRGRWPCRCMLPPLAPGRRRGPGSAADRAAPDGAPRARRRSTSRSSRPTRPAPADLPTVDAVGSLGSSRTTRQRRRHHRLPGTTNSAASACSCTAAVHRRRDRRTASGKRCCSRRSRATTSKPRAARVAQATRQAFFGVQSGQAQVKALEAAEASSQLALEATQLGYKVGVRVNLDVLNAQTPALPDAARPRAGALRRARRRPAAAPGRRDIERG